MTKTSAPRTAAELKAYVEQSPMPYAKVGVFDIDGVLRGKYMTRDKLASSLENGFGFCDVVMGWDSRDQLLDNLQTTGWHTAYPDAEARLLPTFTLTAGAGLKSREFSDLLSDPLA